jgi:nucleoside-diphosphate-sugar epimerase
MNRIQPVAVEDLVEGLILCATVPLAAGQTYNFAGPCAITTGRLIGHIAGVLNVPAPRINLPIPVARFAAHCYEHLYRGRSRRPPIDLQKLSFFTTEQVYPIEKARRELGWEPKSSFEAGVTRAVDTLSHQCRI